MHKAVKKLFGNNFIREFGGKKDLFWRKKICFVTKLATACVAKWPSIIETLLLFPID